MEIRPDCRKLQEAKPDDGCGQGIGAHHNKAVPGLGKPSQRLIYLIELSLPAFCSSGHCTDEAHSSNEQQSEGTDEGVDQEIKPAGLAHLYNKESVTVSSSFRLRIVTY